ncbi:hypothetical protein C0583_05130 [Candidatus Parcubacteria bacterium]|nr:MAG: hypothetical protein C0583_05130 [Candidatus Parcubacteria bacterium]
MKTKRNKKIIALGLLIAMFTLYGVLPLPEKASAVNSFTSASATLSDSDFNEVATTTISVTTASSIPAGGTVTADFHTDFDMTSADATCSGGCVAGVAGQVVTCTYAGLVATSTTITITVFDAVNPVDDGDRTITVQSQGGGEIKDRIVLMVYIIHDVLMTATVQPILEFTITGMASGSNVNGINCDETTTSTTTPFGTLDLNATSTVCQQLNVTTNAYEGYTVTVEQDQELTSDSGSNINSFNNSPNGTGSTTAQTWTSPTNTLDAYHTYGHMGLTSDDQDLNSLGGYNDFYNSGTPLYAGLSGTSPMPIMHHNGPSDGSTQNIGLAHVAYSVEIASLQEAGDYENTLTYIATPTF